MERNENDIFDELVRGKLTNYAEATEPEWIRAIQVKKARTVSLYQLYKLMLIAIMVGAGIFAGIQLLPYQAGTQATTLQQQEENMSVASPSVNPDAAEFASAASGPVHPAVTTSTTTPATTYTPAAAALGSSSTVIPAKTQPAAKSHIVKERSRKTTSQTAQQKQGTNRTIHNTRKTVTKPVQPASLKPGKAADLSKETGKETSTDQKKEAETNKPETDDTKKKDQASATPCKADFDFYTSYSGEFNFIHLAPVAENATINWSFGDGRASTKTSASHLYESSGTYEVTLTIQDGKNTCSASKNIAYQNPAEKTTPITINGKVVAGALPLKNAIVELYAFDDQKGRFKSAQTIRTNQLGEYSIVLQRNARYLLKGYPTGEAQNYLASYWGNTVESENATEIQIMPSEKDNLVGYTIQLLFDEQQAQNDPVKSPVPTTNPFDQQQVFLVDAQNNIVGVGSVDANGKYTFGSGVAPGNYNIVNPGTGTSKPTSISATGDGLSGNISDAGLSSPSSPEDKVIVYPNPANSVVNFGINSDLNETATLVIMDASGVERFREKIIFNAGFNQAQYDLTSYSPGIYYLMIFRNNQEVSSSRIVKLADTNK